MNSNGNINEWIIKNVSEEINSFNQLALDKKKKIEIPKHQHIQYQVILTN